MRDPQHAYLEAKRPPASDTALASQVIEHWQARHLYGKAILITDRPEVIVKLLQKRWATVMQSLQQERARTSDADKLLTLTHSITRMQQMMIAAEPPHEYPAAHFWCVTPKQFTATELPRTCRTLYAHAELEKSAKQHLYDVLPTHSLVVDYNENSWELLPKSILEDKVHHAWEELCTFLKQHDISIRELIDTQNTIEPIDDALDTLLDSSSTFLRHARQFQEVLHLAQPLQLSHATKQKYELVSMLARRVTLLTPGLLHHSFIQAENDTFSLYDNTSPQKYSRETLTAAITRHIAAGRHRLAKALEVAFVNNLPVA
jgi:hypothetical protein